MLYTLLTLALGAITGAAVTLLVLMLLLGKPPSGGHR